MEVPGDQVATHRRGGLRRRRCSVASPRGRQDHADALYHRTDAADDILRRGFRDGEGSYMTHVLLRGVWLSEVPLDVHEGAGGDQVLEK